MDKNVVKIRKYTLRINRRLWIRLKNCAKLIFEGDDPEVRINWWILECISGNSIDTIKLNKRFWNDINKEIRLKQGNKRIVKDMIYIYK